MSGQVRRHGCAVILPGTVQHFALSVQTLTLLHIGNLIKLKPAGISDYIARYGAANCTKRAAYILQIKLKYTK